jgi:hypothetical protein
MYETNKKPNSKGSYANAYKLSTIGLEDKVEHQENLIQLLIGCDDDDTFYKDDDCGRLKVYIETKNPNIMTSFDLEDFLKEVKELCPHLFLNAL